MKYMKFTALAALLLSGAAACGDLVVPNERDPDQTRALANPGDVESLVSGSWINWRAQTTSYNGPGPMLSTMSFQHTTRVANFGQLVYPGIPRVSTINNPADGDYYQWANAYTWNYRAISAVNDAFIAFNEQGVEIEDAPGTTSESEDRNRQARAEAFGRYVQGVSYGYLAIMFDAGPIVDENSDLTATQEFVGYMDLMAASLGYLDEAIAIASASDFEIPGSWMNVAEQPFTSERFVEMLYSYKARIRAAVARTPEERANVDWAQVVADVDNGLTTELGFQMDYPTWWMSSLYYTLLQTGPWSSMPYFYHGMADQSGQYQKYMDLPHGEKHPEHSAVGSMILVTPDLRFPQGATLEEQGAAPGTRFYAPSNYQAGWASSSRGTWRWSYYRDNRNHWTVAGVGYVPDVTMVEMDMLKAEAFLRGQGGGTAADAAALINQTRVEAGLNATDANGTNTSCVPRLPDPGAGADTAPGDDMCGGLWEMMKWEKRMLAGHNHSLLMAPYYFDNRGWGDHMEGTILNWPVPALVAELEGQPIVDYGGTLEYGAPLGTYGF